MGKWKLMFTSLPIVAIVLAVKIICTEIINFDGLLELSEIGLILTAGIFLIGFMLAGTMADYKESEKLPAELATGLEALEETLILSAKSKPVLDADLLRKEVYLLSDNIYSMLMKKKTYHQAMEAFTKFNDVIYSLDRAGVAPPVFTKALNELQALRKNTLRINVISKTGFLSSGYALLELLILIITVLMIITKFKTLEAEIIIVSFVTLIYTYMYRLIKDIDDPFEYKEGGQAGSAEVSLFPLVDYIQKLKNNTKL